MCDDEVAALVVDNGAYRIYLANRPAHHWTLDTLSGYWDLIRGLRSISDHQPPNQWISKVNLNKSEIEAFKEQEWILS